MSLDATNSLALQQNNRGAFFLATRRFDEAIVCLSAALQASKQHLVTISKRVQTLTPDDGAMWFLDQVMSSDPLELDDSRTTDVAASDDYDYYDDAKATSTPSVEENFVYRRAICIPARTLMEFLPDGHDRNVVISISIVFNLALAHHLRAMELKDDDGGQHKQLQLKRAVLLYELAYKLEMEGISGSGPSAVFVMATLNNLGQIHKILMERDTACKCFQNLLSTLMFAVNTGGVLPVLDLDGFFRNIEFLIFQAPAAGAA
jgi:tetratricopeptide (TPR) repeat protein